jgi:hypothetical protein
LFLFALVLAVGFLAGLSGDERRYRRFKHILVTVLTDPVFSTPAQHTVLSWRSPPCSRDLQVVPETKIQWRDVLLGAL